MCIRDSIKPGDYVVHQSHGIGMYAGIQRLEVQGATKDYLKVQYLSLIHI